jgi:hypothetical protein
VEVQIDMASTPENIDIEKAKKMAEHVFNVLGGALVSAMIYLGDRMGLYQALNAAGAMTSEDLASKTGLHERWIREWLYAQAAANLIDYKAEGRFELSPESALVLANENSPFFLAGGFCALPQQMAVLNLLPESFKSGVGLTYDQLGPEVNRGVSDCWPRGSGRNSFQSRCRSSMESSASCRPGPKSLTLEAGPESR